MKCPICGINSLYYSEMIYDEANGRYHIVYKCDECESRFSISLSPSRVAQLLWEKLIEKRIEG